MKYRVEFWDTAEEWRETMFAKLPGGTLTEAERLAEHRSENGMVYRVAEGNKTVSLFQHGKKLPKEDK